MSIFNFLGLVADVLGETFGVLVDDVLEETFGVLVAGILEETFGVLVAGILIAADVLVTIDLLLL